MLDHVDIHVQALGALALATPNTERSLAAIAQVAYEPGGDVVESRRGFTDAVVSHDYAFGHTMPPVAHEIANDQKTDARARLYPFLGGHMDLARESLNNIAHERAFQAQTQSIRTVEQTTGALLSTFA